MSTLTSFTFVHGCRSVKFKLHRAVVVANTGSSYSALIFAAIYLLYPSTSKAVFDIFICRQVAPQMSLLESDYGVQCWDETHWPFALVGAFFALVYPLGAPLPRTVQLSTAFLRVRILLCLIIAWRMVWSNKRGYTIGGNLPWGAPPSVGVPLYLGTFLWRNSDTVKKAPDYIGIAHYKPLFQFYKQDCFMFEIFFMCEKVRRSARRECCTARSSESDARPRPTAQVVLVGVMAFLPPPFDRGGLGQARAPATRRPRDRQRRASSCVIRGSQFQ
jgi:hypothetical protein